jgi:hypothetical protein
MSPAQVIDEIEEYGNEVVAKLPRSVPYTYYLDFDGNMDLECCQSVVQIEPVSSTFHESLYLKKKKNLYRSYDIQKVPVVVE